MATKKRKPVRVRDGGRPEPAVPTWKVRLYMVHEKPDVPPKLEQEFSVHGTVDEAMRDARKEFDGRGVVLRSLSPAPDRYLIAYAMRSPPPRPKEQGASP